MASRCSTGNRAGLPIGESISYSNKKDCIFYSSIIHIRGSKLKRFSLSYSSFVWGRSTPPDLLYIQTLQVASMKLYL